MASSTARTYERMGDFATTAGPKFEVKFTALVYLRALNEGKAFELGSNAAHAGAFDDIVLKVRAENDRWNTFFVQLKHREKKSITRKMLLGEEPSFSLSKTYFPSFLKAKSSMEEDVRKVLFEGHFSDASFIILTNAPGANLGNKCQGHADVETVERYFGTDAGSVFRFNPKGEGDGGPGDGDVLHCLGELGDAQDREAFLRQFYVFCGQSSDDQLDPLIKHELAEWEASVIKETGFAPVDTSLLFDRLIVDLTTWSELRVKHGQITVLDDAGALLRYARTRVLVETRSSLGVDAQTFGVGFGVDAVTSLRDALRGATGAVVHVMASERSTRLTCAKVFQALGKDQILYFAADALDGVHSVLAWHWENVRREYLVVSVSDADAEGDKSERIIEILKMFCPANRGNKQPTKKKKAKNADKGPEEFKLGLRRLVMVSFPGNSLVNRLSTELQDGLENIVDGFEFSQLDDTAQKCLLEETTVSVQNRPTTLLELFDGDPGKADELMVATSTADFLTGDKQQPIGPDLTPEITFYIPRILEKTYDLKTSLLQMPSLEEGINVICESIENVWHFLATTDPSINFGAIEDIAEPVTDSSEVDDRFSEKIFVGEEFRIRGFACNFIGLRCGQADSVNALRIRFDPLQDEDSPDPKWFLFVPEGVASIDADLLAEFNAAWHFLRLRDARLLWRKSLSNVALIRAHLDDSRVVPVVAQGVASVADRVVLLCAEPGMGKSTLVANVAKQTKDAHPEALVLVITLNEHVQLFAEGLHSDPAAFLMKAAGLVTDLQRLWFHLALAMENVIVLLDGFEEVCPKYEEQCRSLLAGLLQTKIRKIWITSRNTKKEELEDFLCLLATKLCAFDEKDQKKFLKMYWEEAISQENVAITGDDSLDIFIAKVMVKTEGAIKDRKKNFMKVPLHAQMVAEVFKPDLANLAQAIDSSEKLDLIDLFDRYSKIKIGIYLKDRVQLGSDGTLYDTMLTQTEERCQEVHGFAALMAILEDDDIDMLTPKNVREHCLELAESFASGHEKTGFIVSVMNGKPRFVHRVFAEYFVAKWFAKHLRENISFLESRLYSGEFSVIREMFDFTLAKGCPLHTAVLKEDVKEVQRLVQDVEVFRSRDHGGRTALHLASSLGTSDTDEENERKNSILELLVKEFDNADEADEVFARSPLYYAAATASWSAVDRLLRCQVDRKCLSTLTAVPAREMLIFASTHDLDELMAFCLAHGLPVDHSLERAGAMLSVACANGSERVAMLLLEGGADVLVKDPAGMSPLLHATRTGKASLVGAILDKVSDHKDKASYLKGSDAFGENALQSATTRDYVDVVRVLLQAIPDSKDKVEFVKACDRFGDNPLLIAARKGNAEVVDMLLKTMPKASDRLGFLKSADFRGDTALRLACKDGYQKVVELVLQGMAKPNDKLECMTASDFDGNNALIIATTRGDTDIVRTLLHALPDQAARLRCVRGATMQGETPLRLAAEKGHAEVVAAILTALEDSPEKTAYIRSGGATGECALAIGTRRGHGEVVRNILASIADGEERLGYIGALWPGGERLLISATRVGCLETVDALLQAIPEERRREHVQDCWTKEGENMLVLATKLNLIGIVQMVEQYFP